MAQQRKDWVTGLGVFGELSGGYCFDVSPALARRLHREETSVLFALGRHLPFESAVGVNGGQGPGGGRLLKCEVRAQGNSRGWLTFDCHPPPPLSASRAPPCAP